MSKQRELEDSVRVLLGAPPYDAGTNYVRGDGYFQADLIKRFGKEAVLNMTE